MVKSDKPSGVMEGLVKNFLGVPDSRFLGTGDKELVQSARQTELARVQTTELQKLGTGQQQAHLDAALNLQEAQKTREALGGLAPHLRGIELSNLAISGRLEELQHAFTTGITEVQGAVVESGREIAGIPTDRQNVEQLIENGLVDEAELTILAAKRWLSIEQTQKLIASLPEWKIRIIKSGLVATPDMEQEKKLTPGEKIYLADLRDKVEIPVEHFRSLNVIGRHRLLDPEVHHALAEDIRSLRVGTEGGAISLRKIDEGTENLVRIGQINLEHQKVGHAQDEVRNRLIKAGLFKADRLIEIGMQSVVQQVEQAELQRELVKSSRAIEATAGETAVNTELIAANTGKAVRTLDAIALTGERTLDETMAIRDHSATIARQTAIIAQSTERAERQREQQIEYSRLSALFAQRADAHLEDLVSLSAANAESNALTARFAQRAELDRANQIQLATAMLEIDALSLSALTDIDRKMGGLVELNIDQLAELLEVNERLGIANEIATAQLEALGEIGGGIRTVNARVAMVYEQLVGVNEGLELLAEIGGAQLEGLSRVEDAVLSSGTHVGNMVEAVRLCLLEVEGRAIDRERNQDRIHAEESFRTAMEMLQIMDIDEAIKHFDRSQDRHPGDFRVFLQRGFCYVCKEMPEPAEKDFRNALKRTKGEGKERIRAVIRLNLARLYYAEHNVQKSYGNISIGRKKLLDAIEEAKKAVDEDPKYLESKFALATYLAALKLLEDAFKLLMEIIPQEPQFATKAKLFTEFEPLGAALHHTFSEEYLEADKNSTGKACIAIAKDSLAIGDKETAVKSVKHLARKNPGYLLTARLWELPEFRVIHFEIGDIINEIIDNPGTVKNWAPDNWYTIAVIALNFEKIPRGMIVKAFSNGLSQDPDLATKNWRSIKCKLIELSGEKRDQLLTLIKLSEVIKQPWLTSNL